jgi:hypothetical protein
LDQAVERAAHLQSSITLVAESIVPPRPSGSEEAPLRTSRILLARPQRSTRKTADIGDNSGAVARITPVKRGPRKPHERIVAKTSDVIRSFSLPLLDGQAGQRQQYLRAVPCAAQPPTYPANGCRFLDGLGVKKLGSGIGRFSVTQFVPL